MYAADLTPYSRFRIKWRGFIRWRPPTLFNVGWLSSDHEYTQGALENKLLDKLFELSREPFMVIKSVDQCPFCNCQWIEGMGGYEASHHDTKIILGNAEVWVPAKDNIIYVAPNMLFHYIRDHQYAPPRPFIDALRSTSVDETRALRKKLAKGFE